MPLRNETPYCVNHPNVEMLRNEGFNALMSFVNAPTGISFDVSRGIPLVVYYCPQCGYVETYVAQKTRFWFEPLPEIPTRQSVQNALRFERAVLDALQRPDSPLGRVNVITDSPLLKTFDEHSFDIIAERPDRVYVVQIKAALSRIVVQQAVGSVMRAAERVTRSYPDRSTYPVLIVPAAAAVPDELFGTVVLKYDQEEDHFVRNNSVALWQQPSNSA